MLSQNKADFISNTKVNEESKISIPLYISNNSQTNTIEISGEWKKKEELKTSNKKQLFTPTKRWGHTWVEYKGFLYLFGGNTSTSHQYASQAVYR